MNRNDQFDKTKAALRALNSHKYKELAVDKAVTPFYRYFTVTIACPPATGMGCIDGSRAPA